MKRSLRFKNQDLQQIWGSKIYHMRWWKFVLFENATEMKNAEIKQNVVTPYTRISNGMMKRRAETTSNDVEKCTRKKLRFVSIPSKPSVSLWKEKKLYKMYFIWYLVQRNLTNQFKESTITNYEFKNLIKSEAKGIAQFPNTESWESNNVAEIWMSNKCYESRSSCQIVGCIQPVTSKAHKSTCVQLGAFIAGTLVNTRLSCVDLFSSSEKRCCAEMDHRSLVLYKPEIMTQRNWG